MDFIQIVFHLSTQGYYDWKKRVLIYIFRRSLLLPRVRIVGVVKKDDGDVSGRGAKEWGPDLFGDVILLMRGVRSTERESQGHSQLVSFCVGGEAIC